MKKILLISFLTVVCAGIVLSAPPPEKVKELKGYLLEKGDVPFARDKGIDAAKWVVFPAEQGGRVIVGDSLVQTLWRTAGQTEVRVKAATFASREDALLAAESRVKELKLFLQLEDKQLKGGQLPGQSAGDRIWGIYDPPEQAWKNSKNPMASPNSRTAAVVFVKKNTCVQVKAFR